MIGWSSCVQRMDLFFFSCIENHKLKQDLHPWLDHDSDTRPWATRKNVKSGKLVKTKDIPPSLPKGVQSF